MPHGRRKVPFSGKAKKLQLQVKKQGQGRPPWNDNGEYFRELCVNFTSLSYRYSTHLT